MIARLQIEEKLREFLAAANQADLAGEERRIARLLLAADLAQTTNPFTLAMTLEDDRDWIAAQASTLEAAGIWYAGRSNTQHYWKPAGAMALIADVLVAQGKARRIVSEFGQINYGPPIQQEESHGE